MFGVLTFCYVKKNTLENSTSAHKTSVKILAYLVVEALVSIFVNIIPPLFHQIENRLRVNSPAVSQLVILYVSNAIFLFPTILIPIITMTLMKPVRDTLKRIFKVCFVCKSDASAKPAVKANQIVDNNKQVNPIETTDSGQVDLTLPVNTESST